MTLFTGSHRRPPHETTPVCARISRKEIALMGKCGGSPCRRGRQWTIVVAASPLIQRAFPVGIGEGACPLGLAQRS